MNSDIQNSRIKDDEVSKALSCMNEHIKGTEEEFQNFMQRVTEVGKHSAKIK